MGEKKKFFFVEKGKLLKERDIGRLLLFVYKAIFVKVGKFRDAVDDAVFLKIAL